MSPINYGWKIIVWKNNSIFLFNLDTLQNISRISGKWNVNYIFDNFENFRFVKEIQYFFIVWGNQAPKNSMGWFFIVKSKFQLDEWMKYYFFHHHHFCFLLIQLEIIEEYLENYIWTMNIPTKFRTQIMR